MRDFPSCFGENGVQVADASCSSVGVVSKTSHNPVTCVYRCKLLGKSCLISVLWSKSLMGQCLSVEIEDASQQCIFKVDVKPTLFLKRKGSRCLAVNSRKIGVFWDLSMAKFGSGPEPLEGYYLAVVSKGEMLLLVGDLRKEAFKKTRAVVALLSSAPFISKREHMLMWGHASEIPDLPNALSAKRKVALIFSAESKCLLSTTAIIQLGGVQLANK